MFDKGTIRLWAALFGAFALVLFDGRQPVCIVRGQKPRKIPRPQVRSSFGGADMAADNKKAADNTLCIFKGFAAV